MKVLNPKVILFTLSILAFSKGNLFAQNGTITINEDPKIKELLALKKEINTNETDSERYKIQVYSGNRNGAQTAQKEFSEVYGSWHPTLQFEAPNFKVWAGNFRTRLEADRALKSIKKTFPSAFIFKPKKG
ncbi:SPOR domain-containing protein [Tamlana sp. 62-3]|uniref:SPOR domain-containing protein n=1 Tax=Neotamlana sargassicola TaxID=2883125 RepID=A0A9X1L5Q2_9FLAO|nr:SPOR domain-containing protein [Tamlana sargassicola]MCB4806824.1 SPOR domain-containing protein [Tamlana sargassicola]